MNFRITSVSLYWVLFLLVLLSLFAWFPFSTSNSKGEELIIPLLVLVPGLIAMLILTAIMVVASIFSKKYPTPSKIIMAAIWIISLPCFYVYLGATFWGLIF